MSDSSPSCQSGRIFEKNIGALRAVDAELADRLAGLPLPPEVSQAEGRDGSPTYKIRTPSGEQWLGFTSMPTVSGPALLRNFDPGEGNVLLAEIGHGTEARLMAEQLSSNRAVFVLERDPVMLALALRLHDLAAFIKQGRLPLIVGDDLGKGLVRFLTDHEGYLAPTRMLGWPWLQQADIDTIKGVLQRSASEASRLRSAELSAVVAETAGRCARASALPDRPRTIVICPHAQSEICEFAGDILSGLAGLDWPAESWLGNTPETGHPLSLARRISAFRPDMAILIDAVRATFGQVMPGTLPVASWFTPWARFPSMVSDGIAPSDCVLAITAGVRDDLKSAGLDGSRVRWLGPAVVNPRPDQPQVDQARDSDVVAIADAPPLDAKSHGMMLSSQQAAWKTARRMIADDIERYTSDDVSRILKQAETESGASFDDPSFRQDMSYHINMVLGQTLVRRAVFEATLRAGVGLTIHGRGWRRHESLVAACRDVSSSRSDVLTPAKVVLHVDVTGNVSPRLLAAACSGAVVVARAHPTDQGECGLSQLLTPGKEILTFRRHSELIGHLKALLSDEPARKAMGDRARQRLTGNHSMAHRLTAIQSYLA